MKSRALTLNTVIATVGIIPLVLGNAPWAMADDEDAPAVVPASGDSATQDSAPATPDSTSSSSNKKGKRVREKDTEGTEARNRFEADPVIRSHYKQDGENLEVDPD